MRVLLPSPTPFAVLILSVAGANQDADSENEDYEKKAEKILKKRSRKGHPTEYLVKWKGLPESKATWEPSTVLGGFATALSRIR